MKIYINKIFFLFLVIGLFNCKKDIPIIEEDDLYTLNIEFEEPIPIDYKIDATLYQRTKEEEVSYEARIERRGGGSISFPKHSYEIDLDEDIPLANLPNDDDWILNANYIDKTFLRHVISFELFTEMNENYRASASKYLEVELNGVYNGLYVLMEKLDKSTLNINGSDETSFIFKEPKIFRETYDGIPAQDPNNYHQQTYPKIDDSDKTALIEDIRDLILNGTDNDFNNEIPNIFDIKNIIDWHLLLLISNNSDGILKNFYLYKVDENTALRVAPWDYDHSFGRDGDNELNIDERPMDIERSILFSRLLEFDWYKGLLKQRWDELNNIDLFSKSSLRQRIITKANLVEELANKNFEVWPLDRYNYYDDNNFRQEVEIMLQFIELRHQRLSEYFDNL